MEATALQAVEGGARLASTVRQKNTLAALPPEHAAFVSCKLLHEESYAIRGSLFEGSKRSVYVARTSRIKCIAFELKILTDLKVLSATGYEDVYDWCAELETKEVLVTTYAILRQLLVEGVLSIDNINVLVIESSHLIYCDEDLQQIMKIYKDNNGQTTTRILALTHLLFPSKNIFNKKAIDAECSIEANADKSDELANNETEVLLDKVKQESENGKTSPTISDEKQSQVTTQVHADSTSQKIYAATSVQVKLDTNIEISFIDERKKNVNACSLQSELRDISEKKCDVDIFSNCKESCVNQELEKNDVQYQNQTEKEADMDVVKTDSENLNTINRIEEDFAFYEKLEWKIEEIEELLCCTADLAEDIDVNKRLSATVVKPKELIVEYESKMEPSQLPSSYVELEKYMRDTVQDALEFINDHRYDPTEIYGEDEFLEELMRIPDPTIDPKEVFHQFLYILEELGPYGADKAAFSLLAKLEKLKVKTPYERHFLLLLMCTSVFVKIRCAAELVFEQLPTEWDRIKTYSTNKVLRFVEILEKFKPPDIDNQKTDHKQDTIEATLEGDPVNKIIIDNPTNESPKELTGPCYTENKVASDAKADKGNIAFDFESSQEKKPNCTNLLNELKECDFLALSDKLADKVNTYECNLADIKSLDFDENSISSLKPDILDRITNEIDEIDLNYEQSTLEKLIESKLENFNDELAQKGNATKDCSESDQNILSNSDQSTGCNSNTDTQACVNDSEYLEKQESKQSCESSEVSKADVKPLGVYHRRAHRTRGKGRMPRFKQERLLQMQLNPDALCGVVFMKEPLMAKILFLVIIEVSRSQPALQFLCAQYSAVERRADPVLEPRDYDLQRRKQEEVLKKFRMHECNLLLATSALEEGIDLPRCNLVIRWDCPPSYRSYSVCRSRARAPRAACVMLAAAAPPLTAKLLHNVALYKQLDQTISRKCGCGILNEPPAIEEIHADTFTNVVKPYSPDQTPESCESTPVKLKPPNRQGAQEKCATETERRLSTPDSEGKENSVDTKVEKEVASVDLSNAISLINRYCSKLPSDTFTRLAPQSWTEAVSLPGRAGAAGAAAAALPAYVCTLRLPLNCPVKYNIVGHPMPSRALARRMAALQACRILHKSGELDQHLMPIGKENFKAPELEYAPVPADDTCQEAGGAADAELARPGTTKRRQYYYKRTAWAFTDCQPVVDATDEEIDANPVYDPTARAPATLGGKRNMLYAIASELCCALPERYNTRGRKLHAPQHARQALAILTCKEIDKIPAFPVYTRSGEVKVSVQRVPDADVRVCPRRRRLVHRFMKFMFSEVLLVRRKGMRLDCDGSTHNNYYVVPTIKSLKADGGTKIDVDWAFLQLIYEHIESREAALSADGLCHYDEDAPDEPTTAPDLPEGDKTDAVVDQTKGDNPKGDNPNGGNPKDDNPKGDNPKGDNPKDDNRKGDDPKGDSPKGAKVDKVDKGEPKKLQNPFLKPGETFVFDAEKYKEAVVTPWYRNQDQPQFFLVAEICWHLSPDSAFPSALPVHAPAHTQSQSHTQHAHAPATFRDYYRRKYGVELTQPTQPLLDVDHTSARLNLLTPRYVNRKGVALPVSSERTRRAKRDHLDQKQILVPELCRVHPFAAPLWFATVALPCVLYRINALLIADEIRRAVAIDVGLGIADITHTTGANFEWQPLNFGWSLAEVLNVKDGEKSTRNDEKSTRGDEKADDVKADAGQSEVAMETDAVNADGSAEVHQDESVGAKDGVETEANKEKTLNDILQEKEDAEFEIGMWSNEMAASVEGEDEALGPLPPNVTFCTSSAWGSRPQPPPADTSDYSCLSSDFDTDDSDLDLEEADGEGGTGAGGKKYASMGVRIEYKTAHEAEAVDVGGERRAPVAPPSCPRDDAADARLAAALLRAGDAPQHYIDKFRQSVEERKANMVENRQIVFKHDPLNSVLPSASKYGLQRTDVDKLLRNADSKYQRTLKQILSSKSFDDLNEVDNSDKGKQPSNTPLGDSLTSICSIKDDDPISEADLVSEMFPYDSDVDIGTGQVPLDKVEANKRALLDKLKEVMPEQEWRRLNCFSMVDVDIDAPGYVNDKAFNVGFDTKEAYVEEVRSTDFKPYYDETRFEAKKEFDFDYQPDLDGHPGPSPCHILQALTMSNANDGINLERLETIGDSFLKFAITAYLYCAHPNVHEGKLSHMRSKQVSNLNLYRLGRSKRLGARMIASKYEPHDNWLPPCHKPPTILASRPDMASGHRSSCAGADAKPCVCKESSGCFIPYNLITQHSIPDKSVADCVEALIGAYLIECGPRGALLFMAWLGMKVLPRHDVPLPPDHPYVRPGSARAGNDTPPPHHKGGGGGGPEECEECPSDEENEAPAADWSWPGRRVGTLRPYCSAGVWYLPVYGELRAPPSPLLRYIDNPLGELEQMLSGYEALEATLRYRFKDRSLLLQALTHASHQRNRLTDCYQRLEFLGDAILDYLITRHLYEDERKHSPGALTDLRSALVNNTIFATLAVRHGFHKFFRHMSPGLNEVLTNYVKIQEENGHSISEEHYLIQEDEMEQAEDVEVPKALGDLFESVAGAIFLDSGMSLGAVWRSYLRLMGAELEAFSAAAPKSPVRELLEAEPDTAKFGKPERLADGRRVRVCVEVFGRGTFKGVGRNYRIAKGTAARCALRHLKRYAS